MPGFQFFSLVHPTAVIGRDETIGSGTVVIAGAIIGPDTTIGNLKKQAEKDENPFKPAFLAFEAGKTVTDAYGCLILDHWLFLFLVYLTSDSEDSHPLPNSFIHKSNRFRESL